MISVTAKIAKTKKNRKIKATAKITLTNNESNLFLMCD